MALVSLWFFKSQVYKRLQDEELARNEVKKTQNREIFSRIINFESLRKVEEEIIVKQESMRLISQVFISDSNPFWHKPENNKTATIDHPQQQTGPATKQDFYLIFVCLF